MIHTPKPGNVKKQTEMDTAMASTIAEARNTVKKMESIKKAPKEEVKPLTTAIVPKKVEKKVEVYTMSPVWMTAIVILVTVLLGGYAIMFFRYSETTSEEIQQLDKRLMILEQKSRASK
jgi:hypothetical protein